MVNGNPITFFEGRYPGTNLCDDSRRLVTQRERGPGCQIPLHRIGDADATGSRADEDIAGTWLRNRTILY
jgi:hypothetical protein